MNYAYYLLDNGAGLPSEIYRGQAAYEVFSSSGLERVKRNGAWSGEDGEIRLVLNLWLQGNFDPEDDQITESKAMEFISEWQLGNWPGRP